MSGRAATVAPRHGRPPDPFGPHSARPPATAARPEVAAAARVAAALAAGRGPRPADVLAVVAAALLREAS